MRSLGSALIRLRLLLLLIDPIIGAATTQSIVSDASFQAIDLCAQNCFQTWVAGCWNPLLDIYLQCVAEATPYCTMASNDCYCRADHQPVAESYLSSCISKSCTVGNAQIDVNSAITVYEGYCASNGYSATAPASTPAQTTSQGPIATTTAYVTKPSSGHSPRLAFVGWDMTLMVFSSLFNDILVHHLAQAVTSSILLGRTKLIRSS